MRSFSDYNPIAITIYFLIVCGIAMFYMNPVILILALLGIIGELHFYMFGLFVMMSLVNPLVSHNGVTVLFVMNHNPITLEACIYGMVASLMIVVVLLWFGFFTQLMTSDKLLYVFGVLSPNLSLVLSMAIRYVSLLQEQAKKIEEVQKVLGLYKEDDIIAIIKGKLRIFSILVTWALENGIITADSMSARGYGLGKRSHFSNFKWNQADVVLIVMSILLGGMTLFWKANVIYYPVFVFPKLTTWSLCSYMAYGILCLIPLMIEGGVTIRWNYLKSKI